ncbi:MAG: CHASE2 domain-containing protein [Treponema sp.]|jgi:adenylate cyclase|nr:CHASE2 domain-containing protein [Treponema sp.]
MGKTSKKKKLVSLLTAHCYLFIVLLTIPLFLTPLDLKIYDVFLRALPSLTESEKIIVLTLDDESMEEAGGFPFRREVMADIVILLRELGMRSISFDLSYLDASPHRLDPEYASRVFSLYLDDGFGEINSTTEQVFDGFAAGMITRADSELYKEEFLNLNDRIRDSLEGSLAFLTRDVDEYFSQALGLTNNSYLTLTMISREHLIGDAELPAPEGAVAEQLARVALKNITASKDNITPDMAGVMPAIPKLMQRSRGAGTVNADPDTDGIRRRVHLLLKLHGEYYGNLTLVGLSEIMGYPDIEVNNKSITLKNAVIDGAQKDIRIPRTRDGSILLKWPKKPFYEYNQGTLFPLIRHTIIEPHLAENLMVMANSGFFSFFDGEYNPWMLYSGAEIVKEDLLLNYSDSMMDEWLALRKMFFEVTEQYLTGGYEEILLDVVSGDAEIEEFVKLIFSECRDQLFRMLQIRNDHAYFDGAFCVIGSDATSMIDIGTTPFEEDYPNVGTYAVIGNMLFSGEFINEAPRFISVIIAFVFSFAVVYISNRLRTGRSLFVGLGAIFTLVLFLLVFFQTSKVYIASAVPIVSVTLSFIVVLVTNFLGSNREKAFLHSAFSRYLAPEVITDIINDPSKLNLGGEKREMTAIFTDIKGFSTISEQLDPTQLVKLLNHYLTAMSNIVMENLGTIDKYIGDAIVAFYGAPVFRPDHAVFACRSAIAMKEVEKEINRKIAAGEDELLSPMPIFTRIGINTGDMVVGNMGAEFKMDYTIMGNAVNLAARLEGVNNQYRTGGILLSEYTREKIGDEFLLRRLDRVRVVGINTPLRLYELLGIYETAFEDERNAVIKWEKALDLYETMQFTQALEMFNSLYQTDPNDKVAGLYIERCEAYLKDPPPANWDAVKNLTEK